MYYPSFDFKLTTSIQQDDIQGLFHAESRKELYHRFQVLTQEGPEFIFFSMLNISIDFHGNFGLIGNTELVPNCDSPFLVMRLGRIGKPSLAIGQHYYKEWKLQNKLFWNCLKQESAFQVFCQVKIFFFNLGIANVVFLHPNLIRSVSTYHHHKTSGYCNFFFLVGEVCTKKASSLYYQGILYLDIF